MSASGRAGDLTDIKHVLVSRDIADAGNEHLRSMGREGSEGFALWAGSRHSGGVFVVEQLIIPAQRGLLFEEGVCVTVDADELFRLNVHLYEHGLELVAQLHSHPHDAYHSETDDAFPIATQSGAFSLVVPDFARRPFAISNCAVYRLHPTRSWVELSAEDTRRLIHVANGSDVTAITSDGA